MIQKKKCFTAIIFLGILTFLSIFSNTLSQSFLQKKNGGEEESTIFGQLYSFEMKEPFYTSNKELVANLSKHVSRFYGGESPSCFNSPASSFLIKWAKDGVWEPWGLSKTTVPRCLSLGMPYTIYLKALDAQGNLVCSGGDFIEALLFGTRVRNRLRFIDSGEGTYTFTLILPDDPLLVGEATITFYHLWHSFGGILTEEWFQITAAEKTVYETAVILKRYGQCADSFLWWGVPSVQPVLPPTLSCRHVDFMAVPFWEGHWVAQNKSHPSCLPGACTGTPSGVLSTSWVYRLPQCVFHLFPPVEARLCLNGSWFFSSGDSNAPDTAANLAQDTLGLNMEGLLGVTSEHKEGGPLHRTFDWLGGNGSATLEGNVTAREEWHLKEGNGDTFCYHITQVWSAGKYECCAEDAMLWGISVVKDASWRNKNIKLLRSMGGDRGPDVLFINSGLHDGVHYLRSKALGVPGYLSDLENFAIPWWQEMGDWAAGGNTSKCRPRMIWRHSVASAGPHRKYRANPQSMAIFNRVTAGALFETGLVGVEPPPPVSQPLGVCKRPLHTDSRSWRFLDMYDLTFPFHFNLDVSDGGHYGRHFCEGCDSVDRMQLQVLLNGLCR